MTTTHVHSNGKTYNVLTGQFYYNLSGKYFEPYNAQYRDEETGVENAGWSVDTAEYILVPSADGGKDREHKTGSIVLKSIATAGNVKGHAPSAQAEINRLTQIIGAKDKMIDGLQIQLANVTASTHAYQAQSNLPVGALKSLEADDALIIEPSDSSSDDDFEDQLKAAVASKSRKKATA